MPVAVYCPGVDVPGPPPCRPKPCWGPGRLSEVVDTFTDATSKCVGTSAVCAARTATAKIGRASLMVCCIFSRYGKGSQADFRAVIMKLKSMRGSRYAEE